MSDALVIGGDGYVSHDRCAPEDATGDLSGPEGDRCWICGGPVEEANDGQD